MANENVISAALSLIIEGKTNSYGKAVAYYKNGNKWEELGRGDIDSYENHGPHPYKIVVSSLPVNVREIVVCNDKLGAPPNASASPPVYL